MQHLHHCLCHNAMRNLCCWLLWSHVSGRLKVCGAHVATCLDVGSSAPHQHHLWINSAELEREGREGRGGGGCHLTWSQRFLMSVREKNHLKDASWPHSGHSGNTLGRDWLLTFQHFLWWLLYRLLGQLSGFGLPVRAWQEMKDIRSHGLSAFPSKTSSEFSSLSNGLVYQRRTWLLFS